MATAPISIGPAPVVPDASKAEADFDADYEERMRWEGEVMVPGINALATNVYTNALAVAEDATAAQAAAGQAGLHASAAGTAAVEAINSASAAAVSAAEARYVTRLYLGPLNSDPATGSGGAPLVDGNWYINLVSGFIRCYTNSAGWVHGVTGVSGVSTVNGQTGNVTTVTSINGLTGLVIAPTQAEAEAGIENTKPMTSLRTSQAIAKSITGSLLRITVITASSTWTRGQGTKKVRIRLVGGGGAGGGVGGASGTIGGSGAGAGYAETLLDVSAISTVAVIIGAGGAATATDGGNGGTTSFGSYCAATGGMGGLQANGGGLSGSVGGYGTIGQILIGGEPGMTNGSSTYPVNSSFPGGNSLLGFGGAPNRNGAGLAPAYGYGGGGSGAHSLGNGASGGPGKSGVCIVEEYA
ncbi:hypothetical protein GCM10027395_00520 [Giesbergeria sinuosa]